MGAEQQGAQHTDGRWKTINRTLCFLLCEDDVLLLKRSMTTRIFPGRFNGVGGHIERGEDPLTCARREILEETGISVHTLALRAIYTIDANAPTGIIVYVFVGTVESRAIVDSSEGVLHWVPRPQLPDYPLVDDLYEVLPRILAAPAQSNPLFIQMRYNEQDQLVLQFIE
jgi:8-oxo-dGTP diphosphatase